MPRYENLTGKRFGRLIALEATNKKTSDGRRIWKCQCDCGNIKYTSCQNLKRGHCTSCGCKNKEQITALGHSRAIDISGKKFGMLTALKKADKKLPYSDSIAWVCKCDCGNKIIATVSQLNSGNTLSCGCNHRSEGEILIEKILTNEKIIFETEKQFADLLSFNQIPLRFDFFIPEKNCLIEFDGEQHYKALNNRYFSQDYFLRDCKKNEYCLSHGINLYRIPYYEKQNIKKEQWTSQSLFNDKFLVKEINHYHLDIPNNNLN